MLQVDRFPELALHYLLGCSGPLRLVQFVCPMPWLSAATLRSFCQAGCLAHLEMLVLANTSDVPMDLGLDSVRDLIRHCPDLGVIANLRTWARIDYFDPASEFYFRTESAFSQLKRDAVSQNWDIEFDLENIDFCYESYNNT